MKLHATIFSEKGKELEKTGNEFITFDLTVNREPIGEIELYIFDDMAFGNDTDEWLLKYRKDVDSDWEIIAQGNSKSTPRKPKA